MNKQITLPTSVKKLKEEYPELFYKDTNDWYAHEAWFTKEITEIKWVQTVSGSINKPWEEQLELLGDEEEVPEVQEVIAHMIRYFLQTKKKLYQGVWVRTATLSRGYHVDVGFNQGGIYVDYHWDDDRRGSIGLASARNSPGPGTSKTRTIEDLRLGRIESKLDLLINRLGGNFPEVRSSK